MKIGIIGSGKVGSKLGELWVKAGHQVMFSFSRNPERLKALAEQMGSNARHGTPAEAVQFGEVILLAPNFSLAPEAVNQAGSLAGKIVIDTTNPYRLGENNELVRMVDENASAAEEILKLVPGARLVKAFSSFQPSSLQRLADRASEQRLAVAIASDDDEAKAIVSKLAEDCKGKPFDLGSLHNARLMEIPGPFSFGDNLTLESALALRKEVLGY
ncbi:MAG: NADPH-dependent F420 reductase [Hydrococcus sp. Prado102]|nr:NADPH-dependent F420 reductase [Hydrococcus sp. Prado102]